jgi:hypothetical protein
MIGSTATNIPDLIKGVFFTKNIKNRVRLNTLRNIIRNIAPKPLALLSPSVTKVEK